MKTASASRLTAWGLYLLLLSCVAIWLALTLKVGWMLWLGAAGLALLGCSWLAVRRQLRGIELNRRLPNLIFAKEPTTLEISAVCRLPGISRYAIVVSDTWLSHTRVERDAATELLFPVVGDLPVTRRLPVRFPQRGRFHVEDCLVYACGPLGLIRTAATLPAPASAVVYPRPILCPEIEPWLSAGQEERVESHRASRAREGSFHGLRDFSHGDSVRLIAWPASHRLQRLVVREYDRVVPQTVAIVLHGWAVRRPRRRFAFEALLGRVAWLLIDLHRRGIRVRLVADFNRWRPLEVDEHELSLQAALESLAMARQRRQRRPDSVVRRLRVYSLTHCLIVGSHAPVDDWQPTLKPLAPHALYVDGRDWHGEGEL